MARTLRSDRILFSTAMGLVATGVVMVVSAQIVESPLATSALRQLLLATIGVLGMFAAMRTDYHHLRRPAVIWALVAVAAAGLVLVFFFDKRNGAHRWIELFGQTIQPSELAKLAAIVFAAAVLERRMHRINDVKYSLMPIALVVGPLAFLILKEPDLGTPAVIVLILVAMAYAAGLRARRIVAGFFLMLPLLAYSILAYGFRVDRMLGFLGLSSNPLGADYQLNHSKMALGSGGVFGRGLNASLQKLHFLPEAHNDFIFSIIGEEFGLIGATALVACFLVIAWRGLRAALLAPDRFGTLVGIGLAMMLGMQAFINMSVVTGLAPTKGIPLPLVSAGGSSLLINLLAMGILLNISQQASKTAAAAVDAR